MLEVREPSAQYLVDLQPAVLRQFELLATAPEGMTRLRELIVTLAIRGRLVPQNPSDEPAEQHLAHVRVAMRKRMTRPATHEPIAEEEQQFELPRGWSWCRLAELALPQAGFAFKSSGFNEVGQGRPLIRIRDVGSESAPTTYFAGEFREEFVVETDEWLISMDGEFRVRTWQGPTALLNQRVTRLSFFSPATSQAFVAAALQRELSALQGVKAYTTVDHLSGRQIAEAVIALPPESEQFRIVARVDELMRLSDALEANGRLEAEQHARLLSTLLGTLTDSRSPEELAANWQRVAAHFDLLLDRPEAVDEAERAVLHLAFEGRLTCGEQSNAQVRPSGDVVEYLNGYAFKSDWFRPSGVRLARNVNVAHGHLDWTETACVATDIAEQFARFALTVGDILVSLDRPLISTGLKYAVVRQTDLPCLLLQRVALLKPKEEFVLARYVELWLTSPQFINSIDPGRSNGVPHISTRQLQAIHIRVPDLAEQARIVARVEHFRRLCADLRQRLAASQSTQARLADAIVESATVA